MILFIRLLSMHTYVCADVLHRQLFLAYSILPVWHQALQNSLFMLSYTRRNRQPPCMTTLAFSLSVIRSTSPFVHFIRLPMELSRNGLEDHFWTVPSVVLIWKIYILPSRMVFTRCRGTRRFRRFSI